MMPTAVVALPDACVRQRAAQFLTGLRWNVAEAGGGAEALFHLEAGPCEAVLLDSWLPDLDVAEVVRECATRHPLVDLVMADGEAVSSRRSPRRQELLMALRHALDSGPPVAEADTPPAVPEAPALRVREDMPPARPKQEPLAELVGRAPAMLELSRMIRLVAPRTTTVLIKGETGTGKELVARALHRLSLRARKPMMVLNCAAIPESLLEAELFGHTRGAFTGAIANRVGRIEAADGGTLFLDEIGEMPLMLQSKLLRFLECGELQRVGDNEPVKVDVRVIAATHQPLEERARQNTFRADLYYRLSVFPLRVPPLAARRDDIPLLAEYFLKKLAQRGPAKTLAADALQALVEFDWPGNVRQLEHVMERATILVEDEPQITREFLDFS